MKNQAAKMNRAYQIGVTVRGEDIVEAIYSGDIPDWVFIDGDAEVFFEAGYRGCECPQWVNGWRYGDIPEGGRSYNYRDNLIEDGVSVMAIDGGDGTRDIISSLFIAADGRPVVKVAGYLNPYRRGSDGEPLIICAEKIED